jgi:ABC-type transporter MlaC component
MMRRVLFTLAISLTPALLPTLATSVAAQPAPAKAGPGTDAVKKANDTIFALIKKKAPAAEVTKAVGAFFNINELGKAAMADQWSKLKPAEQTEFLKILTELIQANYIKIQTDNVNYTTKYVSETTNAKGNLVVGTEVEYMKKGRPQKVKIDYELIKNGASYQAFDFVLEGSSTVDSYRQSFNKIMKDKGFAGLMTTMKTKLQQVQSAPGAGGGAGTGGGGGAGTGGGSGSAATKK